LRGKRSVIVFKALKAFTVFSTVNKEQFGGDTCFVALSSYPMHFSEQQLPII